MEENRLHDRRAGIGREVEQLREELVALLPRLRRFARALTRNAHDADDLVQLALERALARAAQRRPEMQLAGWVFGILRNAWVDEQRARGRRARLFAPEESGVQVADASGSAAPEMLAVQEALERLPEEQRVVVALVLVEGLSYKEAAHVIEVPIGTVTSRLARARETLQSLLGGAGA
jgi:RNA polymerase sigma-70 factor, ECF subfamily